MDGVPGITMPAVVRNGAVETAAKAQKRFDDAVQLLHQVWLADGAVAAP
jgi:hypothetical protein